MLSFRRHSCVVGASSSSVLSSAAAGALLACGRCAASSSTTGTTSSSAKTSGFFSKYANLSGASYLSSATSWGSNGKQAARSSGSHAGAASSETVGPYASSEVNISQSDRTAGRGEWARRGELDTEAHADAGGARKPLEYSPGMMVDTPYYTILAPVAAGVLAYAIYDIWCNQNSWGMVDKIHLGPYDPEEHDKFPMFGDRKSERSPWSSAHQSVSWQQEWEGFWGKLYSKVSHQWQDLKAYVRWRRQPHDTAAIDNNNAESAQLQYLHATPLAEHSSHNNVSSGSKNAQ